MLCIVEEVHFSADDVCMNFKVTGQYDLQLIKKINAYSQYSQYNEGYKLLYYSTLELQLQICKVAFPVR